MKIEDFTRGWIVGDFQPCLVQTEDVEVGILSMNAGDKGDGHWHKRHKEFNIILSGSARSKSKNEFYFEGDICVYEPFEKSDIEFFEDTKLLVIKSPATKDDKYYA